MTALDVHVVVEEATLSSVGSFVGPVWLQRGSNAFPAIKWTDFVVPVLGMWCAATEKLWLEQSPIVELLFMDGSYAAVIEPSPQGWTVQFKNTYSNQTQPGGVFDRDRFVYSLLKATLIVRDHCAEKGIEPVSLAFLTSAAESLMGHV